MFMMNTVTELTLTREQLTEAGLNVSPANAWALKGYAPLVEGKMFHQFDHRFGTYEGQTEAQANQGKLPEFTVAQHADPFAATLPRYWLPEHEVHKALDEFAHAHWLVSWRDVTSSVVVRTVIASVLPPAAANDSAPLVHLPGRPGAEVCGFLACLNSFALDFIARQKLGGNHLRFFTFFQLPLVTPEALGRRCAWNREGGTFFDWLVPRVLELTYTAWDLRAFAEDCRMVGPPFRWDDERRRLIRCEVDAAFFHLFLPADDAGDWVQAEGEAPEDAVRLKEVFPTPRHAVEHIMDSFPIVRARDEERYDGDYRTKRAIVEIYDAMHDAIRTGRPYQTRLDPPPADPRCCHPPREVSQKESRVHGQG